MVKLIMCDSHTGIVLNQNMEWHNKKDATSESELYFKDLNEAKKYISTRTQPNISFEVYDEAGLVLYKEESAPDENFTRGDENLSFKKKRKSPRIIWMWIFFATILLVNYLGWSWWFTVLFLIVIWFIFRKYKKEINEIAIESDQLKFSLNSGKTIQRKYAKLFTHKVGYNAIKVFDKREKVMVKIDIDAWEKGLLQQIQGLNLEERKPKDKGLWFEIILDILSNIFR